LFFSVYGKGDGGRWVRSNAACFPLILDLIAGHGSL